MAALSAAVRLGDEVGAVVSRGGRVDLATNPLADVRAPALLVVGGDDTSILALNRAARADLGGPTELAVVDGAGHRFEQSTELAMLAERTAWWVDDHLG
jgi:pimeloyl-ACP methyl ester carboxylesterase